MPPRRRAKKYCNYDFVVKESLSMDLPQRIRLISRYCIWHCVPHGSPESERYNIYGYIQFFRPKSISTLLKKWPYETDWTPTTRFDHLYGNNRIDWSKFDCFTFGSEALEIPIDRYSDYCKYILDHQPFHDEPYRGLL